MLLARERGGPHSKRRIWPDTSAWLATAFLLGHLRPLHETKGGILMTKMFAVLGNWVATSSGHPAVFAFAAISVVIWLATGPVFSYSDTWQLIMNT
jgi:hypothetical protein